MKNKSKKIIAALGALLIGAAPAQDKPVPEEGQSKVQLAILLDTSGSMSGLIDRQNPVVEGREHLYRGETKRTGPFVEVALFEYGQEVNIPTSSGRFNH